MRRSLLVLLFVVMAISCVKNAEKPKQENPLLTEWKTPFKTPPFSKIKAEHFLPAFKKGMEEEKAEIEKIATCEEKPDFNNTIKELEKAGRALDKVSAVFYALKGANTNDEIKKIANEVTPLLSKHSDDINLDPRLFKRVETVYNNREELDLNVEEENLLKNYYLDFVRSGAALSLDKQKIMREINKELSVLALDFSDHLLKETNAIGLIIDNKEDLAGLPENVVQGAAKMAEEKGRPGKWVFTLQKPSFIPFLQYSEKRKLREKLFKGYVNRGNNDNEDDNKKIIARIAALRVKKANLLGYGTHADYVLERNMAKEPKKVMDFLDKLWEPALERARSEAEDMRKMIRREGGKFDLAAWDWWYYAEKVKKEKYDLDEETLRPYFKIDNVLNGAFSVANRLYGVTFTPLENVDVYHKDVKVFEVKEKDGSHIGVFYCDYFPRDSKRSGAWSSGFRSQSNIDGNWISPLVFNVGNFSKPTPGKPALLSLDEVETLFHELGHGLDALLSNTTYSGARRIPRDFVELPSQIMENWAFEPAVLKEYAKHYETDQPIPDVLVEKITRSGLFNQGFATVEYLAASYLDMNWHMLKDTVEKNTAEFDEEVFSHIGLTPEIASRYQSTNFAHIVGGYSSGYYSYMWAEVLDADAFAAFKEKGLFDRELADKFRKHVLAVGGTEDCMELYKRFRGKEPDIKPLLKNRGLISR